MLYIVTIILHYLIGFMVLYRLKVKKNIWEMFGLAFPFGLGSATLLLFLLDILTIPLTFSSITITTILAIGVLTYPLFPELKRIDFSRLLRSFKGLKTIAPAEWLFLTVITGLFLISLWRCAYLPIVSYDSIHGIDLVAKSAVKDGKIASQMFSDLKGQLTTQPYYAPFTAFSQILYRLSGHPFGKIWISFMFLSLLIIIYVNLRREIHPALVGLLTVILIAIPEFYAYTFILQTDFSNAVFVALAIIYLFQFIKKKNISDFWIAVLLFGLGVWTRSETIAFAFMTSVLIFYYIHQKDQSYNPYQLSGIFLGVSLFFFCIWNFYYLPVVLDYSPQSYFKFGFWDYERFSKLFQGMMNILTDYHYWGYIFHFFAIISICNFLFFRDRSNLFVFIWIVLLFLGFWALLYHLQLNLYSNINQTFRRGSFKFWPLMIYYIGTSCFFKKISTTITKWENT